MNKILFIVFIAAAIILGVVIAYRLNFGPAVTIVESVQSKIGEVASGGVDLQTVVTAGSLAGTGVTALNAYNQYKGKISAQASALKESVMKTDAVAQVEKLTQTKDQLSSQLTSLSEQKDQALLEAETAKAQFSDLEAEIKRLENQIDGFHSLIPDMKDKDIKTVIEKAMRVP